MKPQDYFGLSFDVWTATARAQSVMTMRLLGLAGAWNLPDDETHRMLTEKPKAFAEGFIDAWFAALNGGSAPVVMRKAAQPAMQRVATNARRLQQRGPF